MPATSVYPTPAAVSARARKSWASTPRDLVNNAGFGTHHAFTEADPDRLQAMIALNVGALVDLTRAFIEPLAAAEHGVLINVASLLGFQPTPYLAVYGATKASSSASPSPCGRRPAAPACASSRSPRVRQKPSSTTPPKPVRRLRRQACTPQDVVRIALKTVDRASGPPSVITNGRPQALMSKFLPRRQVVRFMGATQRRAMSRG